MTFDETNINRATDGKFATKHGSEPTITLGDTSRATRRLLERYPQTRFTPGAGAPAEFTLQPEDIPAPLMNPFKEGDRVVIPARTRIAREQLLGHDRRSGDHRTQTLCYREAL